MLNNLEKVLIQHKQLETNTDLTLPGFNYMGPGTHIASNILEGRQPVSLLDQFSLVHDIELLKYSTFEADKNFSLNVHKYGDIKDQIMDTFLIGKAFTVKTLIPGLDSLIEEDKPNLYESCKTIVIEKGWVQREMFLEFKSGSLIADTLYGLSHPTALVKDTVLNIAKSIGNLF